MDFGISVGSLWQGEISLSAVGVSLLNLPFAAQGHGVLWFMYTLVGLYLLAPILQSWLRTATQREVGCICSCGAFRSVIPLSGCS